MRHLKIFLLSILSMIIVCAASNISKDRFDAPGMKGMNSVWDVDNLDPAHSRYSLNVNLQRKPGKVTMRDGFSLVPFTNTTKIFGAFGFVFPQINLKQNVGIIKGDSGFYVGRAINGDTITHLVTGWTNPAETTTYSPIRRFSYSANGKALLRESHQIPNTVLYDQKDYDFALIDGNLIISDGKNIPYLYVPYSLVQVEDLHSTDTIALDGGDRSPWVTSLGMEAPGQLRVGPLYGPGNWDWSGNGEEYLTGTYRYTYRHRSIGHADLFHYDSITLGTHSAIPSRWVILNNERPYLTLFEGMPDPATLVEPENGDTLSWIYIERQKYQSPWYRIDSFLFRYNEIPFYIDSLPEGTGNIVGPATYGYQGTGVSGGVGKVNYNFPEGSFGNTFQYIKDYKDLMNPVWPTISGYDEDWTYWAPGALFHGADSIINYDMVGVNDSFNMPRPDSFYYIGYSYYDPILDIESPIGPLSVHSVVDSVTGSGWLRRGFQKSYTNLRQRPSYIRVYRSENKGSGDSLRGNDYLFCVAQVRANNCYPNDSATHTYTVFPGFGHDSQLTTGYDFVFTTDTAAGYNYTYSSNEMVLGEFGDAFIRPPFVKQLEIPLSDIQYFKHKLFGIGDPLFPNRLYYSDAESFYQWSALEYISIAENAGERLVALATARVSSSALSESQNEIMYAIKNNEIFVVSGYDVEYDLNVAKIEGNIGAINKRAIIKADNTIFFMSPNLKIYSLSGYSAVEISLPIENWIDSLFSDYKEADSTCYTYRSQTKVYFSKSKGDYVLAYDWKIKTWSIENYALSVLGTPTSFIKFDTTLDSGQTVKPFFGYDDESYWVYVRDTFQAYFIQNQDGVDLTASHYITSYQTPFVGDGEFLWRIRSVEFSLLADSGSYVIMEIYNEREVLLLTDSLQVKGVLQTVHYNNGFANHASKYLSIRFSSDSTTTLFELSDIVINKTKVGVTGVGY